jgi:hypothetical protein
LIDYYAGQKDIKRSNKEIKEDSLPSRLQRELLDSEGVKNKIKGRKS